MKTNKAIHIEFMNLRFLRRAKRAITCGVLTVLPLCGLILFFEITRPAHHVRDGFFATQIVDNSFGQTDELGGQVVFGERASIARFKGVSAELGQSGFGEPAPKIFTASDAERAFSEVRNGVLKVGFETEFLNKYRHRMALRIVSRMPIIDEPVPENSRLMEISPASTSKLVTFVWGDWLYRAEIEDKGFEPDIVVQKVL